MKTLEEQLDAAGLKVIGHCKSLSTYSAELSKTSPLLIDMTAAGETLVLEPTTCFSYRRHTGSASSTSLLHGSRLVDERHYYRDAALQMESRGWPRAARTARRRWTSRLHALTLVPSALKDRSPSALHTVGSHAFTR